MNPAPHVNRGIAYLSIGDYDKAINDLDKVIQVAHLIGIPHLTTVYNNRGVAHNHRSELDKAIRDFNKAIEIDPNNNVPYFNLGMLQLISEDLQTAQSNLSTARDLGCEIASMFRKEYCAVDAFQLKYNVIIPDEIVSMLAPDQQ